MKKIIPFGDRLLVKRKKVGGKSGSIHLPDSVKERPTDLAEVIYVPEHSFADKELLENADSIVKKMTDHAKSGSYGALNSLLSFNEFLKIKSIQPGDNVFISKYVGTDFYDSDNPDQSLTLCRGDDILGVVVG